MTSPPLSSTTPAWLELDKILINEGFLNSRDVDGFTALNKTLSAIGRKYSFTRIMFLLEDGANVNIPDNKGYTPLMNAIRHYDARSTDALINAGADIGIHNKYSETALLLAVQVGSVKMVRRMIKAGSSLNERNIDSKTPLMYAAECNHIEVVNELIQAGSDIEARDICNNTALITAMELSYPEIGEVLIKAGANINAQNNQRRTPLSGAMKHRNMRIARIITGIMNTGSSTLLPVAAVPAQPASVAVVQAQPAFVSVEPAFNPITAFSDSNVPSEYINGLLKETMLDIARTHGLHGYSKLNKEHLAAFLIQERNRRLSAGVQPAGAAFSG